MTTPTPAASRAATLPALPEPHGIPGFYDILGRQSLRYTADDMRTYALAALEAAQPASPAPLTDEQIIAAEAAVFSALPPHARNAICVSGGYLVDFARAVLALASPVQVAPSPAPLTDERAAFESFVRRQYAPNAQHTATLRHRDGYKRDDVQKCWEGWQAHASIATHKATLQQRPNPLTDEMRRVLVTAEAALADIGDADREPGDDVAWCEARAAKALPVVRAMLKTSAAALASPQVAPALTRQQIDNAQEVADSKHGVFTWGEAPGSWRETFAHEIARSIAAPAPVAPTPAQPSLRSQHDADSKELRSLCQARDEARRERDLLKVGVAALESSVGHLSRLIDDLRPGHDRYQYLRERPVDTIEKGGVFAGLVPDNVVLNGEDLDRAIDAALPSEPEGESAK